jgi:hypothetical protein
MTQKIKDFKGLFTNKNGKVVIAQVPNPALLGWAIFLILGHLLDSENLKWLSSTFLFTWAFMEIYQGVSYFRRFLGAAVLLYIIFTRFS